MKKIFTLLLALVASTALWAEDFSVGGIYYKILTDKTNEVEVTYCGSYYSSYNEYSGSVTIPSTVTYNGTTYSVTNIGYAAFAYCFSLTSVTIPNSVTSIGGSAFYECSGLTSITIPNSVTSIGNIAFYHCSGLTSPVYNAHCFAYLPISYQGAYTIPEGIKQIAGGAFEECTGLTTITIPNSVTSIGRYAFFECKSLTKTNYTGDIAGWCNIEFGDFYANPISYSHNLYINDQEIKNLVIPTSVDSIHNYAFSGCSSLTSVTIPNSVTSIGANAFSGCSSLTSITIPNSVTSIGEEAFYDCSGLTSVTIPNSVTSIGESAFSGCSSLSSVAIGNGVTEIRKSAFAGCTGLNLLRLGTGIQNIDDNAFANCTKLYDIYCLAAEPPTGYTSSFANYNAFLHVPCESQRLYMLDILFGEFKYIECIASDEVTTDDIVITPGSTDVTITWPTENNADTYTIVIKKDGEVVCTLTFNADGQLLNIAFAPGRDGNHPAQYAEQANNGYRFTVTGLEEATDYTYTITTKDASNKTISEHSGEFTTNSTTALDNTHSQSPITNCQKILRNGQLIILRDGKTYNAQGVRLEL